VSPAGVEILPASPRRGANIEQRDERSNQLQEAAGRTIGRYRESTGRLISTATAYRSDNVPGLASEERRGDV
jgi:hypothetical protein